MTISRFAFTQHHFGPAPAHCRGSLKKGDIRRPLIVTTAGSRRCLLAGLRGVDSAFQPDLLGMGQSVPPGTGGGGAYKAHGASGDRSGRRRGNRRAKASRWHPPWRHFEYAWTIRSAADRAVATHSSRCRRRGHGRRWADRRWSRTTSARQEDNLSPGRSRSRVRGLGVTFDRHRPSPRTA